MTRTTILLAVAALAALLPAAVPARAEQGAGTTNTPGPIHEKMARTAGDYSTATKLWPRDGAAAIETSGTARFRLILGGRFLQEEDTGGMAAEPFSTLRLWGYNSVTKQFESAWLHTGSTSMLHLTGTSKDDGKTVEWSGSFANEKGEKITLLVTTRAVDADHFVVSLTGRMPDGSKGASMETTYTRKK